VEVLEVKAEEQKEADEGEQEAGQRRRLDIRIDGRVCLVMSKNGNGEGSIYPHKRNGKKVGYRGAYVVHTAERPKRRYVSGKTREEVHEKVIEALSNRDKGLIFDASSLTVGEYLESWLKGSVKGTVRQSTY
jgi:integrase